MWEKMKKHLQTICDVLELVTAIFVLVGILLAIVNLLGDFDMFRSLMEDSSAFKEYLEKIFTVVIGIEFLQMLCRSNSDNVLEILIFLVARHMIVGETTPYEDFVSVISVALLCVVRRYLSVMKNGGQWRFGKQKNEEP